MIDSVIIKIRAQRVRIAMAFLFAAAIASGPFDARAKSQPQSPPNSNVPSASTPGSAPTAIPVPDVITRAEQVSATLRNIRAGFASERATSAIEEELPALTQEIDLRFAETSDVLEARPSLETLRNLEAEWRSVSKSLSDWKRTLTARATEVEQEMKRLVELSETWEHTLEVSRIAEAPAVVVEKIEATIAAIRQARDQVESRRAQVLTLQNRVSQQESRVADVLTSVRQVRDETVRRLFVKDSPPIWSATLRASLARDMVRESRDSLSTQFRAMREYAAHRAASFFLHIAIFLLLVAAFYWARRRTGAWVEAEPGLEPTAQVFNLPFASALLLSILASSWIYPQPPRLLSAILGAISLIPTVIILRQLVERPLLPILNALVVFYFADRLRDVAESLPLLLRLLFLAETLGGIIFLLWLIRSERPAIAPETEQVRLRKTIKIAGRIALLLLLVVFVANAYGYVALARLVGNAVLGSAYVAVIFYAAIKIAEGLVMVALRIWPLALLGMVERHRSLLLHQARRMIRWLALLFWILFTLEFFSLREALFNAISNALAAELVVGNLHISSGIVLLFILTVWASFVLSRFLRFILEEDVYPRITLAGGVPYAISTMLHYSMLLVGFLLAMTAIGVNLDRFAILAGAFGVGIGFGLQNIVNNFVSGLILLFERPVKVGDMVQLSERGGELKRIGLRASVLRTWEGAEVIVPNGKLISDEVINWTLSDQQRRIELSVGVAYGTDPEQVIELLTQVALTHPDIMPDPPPQAFFLKFGDNSLDFQLRAWTGLYEQWMVTRSDLMVAVNAALRDANISIPFPQRDLHLKNITPEMQNAIKDSR